MTASNLTRREATIEEVAEEVQKRLNLGVRVIYGHDAVELPLRTAKNGVQHVQHHGEKQPLKGEVLEFSSGTRTVVLGV